MLSPQESSDPKALDSARSYLESLLSKARLDHYHLPLQRGDYGDSIAQMETDAQLINLLIKLLHGKEEQDRRLGDMEERVRRLMDEVRQGEGQVTNLKNQLEGERSAHETCKAQLK